MFNIVYIFSSLYYMLSFILLFFYFRHSNKNYLPIFLYFTVVSSLPFMLRDISSSTDYENYYLAYEIPLEGVFDYYSNDPVFSIFTWIFQSLSIGFEGFVYALSMLIVFVYSYSIYRVCKYEKMQWLSLLMLFLIAFNPDLLLVSSNAYRQGVACSLVFLGFTFYLSNKKYGFIFLTLASMTHKSAILFLFIYLFVSLFKFELSKRVMFFFILVIIINAVFSPVLFAFAFLFPGLNEKIMSYQLLYEYNGYIFKFRLLLLLVFTLLSYFIYISRPVHSLFIAFLIKSNLFFYFFISSLWKYPFILSRLSYFIVPLTFSLVVIMFKFYIKDRVNLILLSLLLCVSYILVSFHSSVVDNTGSIIL